MAMYLGEDKVASLGSICNVSGRASKNLFDAYKYSENKTHTGNVSKYNIINPNEIEISYINGWSRLVLTLTGLEPNTDYTISAYLDKSNFSTSVGSGFYALDNYQDNAFTKGSGNVYFTFTSSSTGTFDMWFYGNWSGTNYSGSVIYQNIQLEKGSNATEYEKYFEPTISIKDSKGDYHEVPYMTGKVSKNLFNKNDVLKGYWISNGNIEVNTLWNVGGFFKVEPDTTYSYSSTLISGKSEIQTTILYYDINGNRITHSYFQTLTKTEKTPSNCYYARITYRNDVLENIQFEKGSTITSYEEYYEPSLSIKNSNGVFQEVELNRDNYSLGEQLVGTYLGKPFYKKTFIVNSPSQTSSSEIIVKLDSNCSIVKYEGFLETSAKARYQLNAWFSTTDYIYSFIPNLNEIKLRVSLSAYTSRPIEVTIWYTKG